VDASAAPVLPSAQAAEAPSTKVTRKKRKAVVSSYSGTGQYVSVDPYLDEVHYNRPAVQDTAVCFPCAFLEKPSVLGDPIRLRFKHMLAQYGYIERRVFIANIQKFYYDEYLSHNPSLAPWPDHEIINHVTHHGQTPHVNILRQEINDLDAMILMHKRTGIVQRDSITGAESLDKDGLKVYSDLIKLRMQMSKMA
jgi:hypothetical protein